MARCIHDCHCHLGVAATVDDAPRLAQAICAEAAVRPLALHIMTCNHLDLAVLQRLIALDTGAIIPYFGIHPWYSHLFSTTEHVDKGLHYRSVLRPPPEPQLLAVLPPPIYVGHHLATMRRLAQQCVAAGTAYGIGEIGLDRLFRLPASGFYGNNAAAGVEGLTAAKVTMAHQRHILAMQLQLALELAVPVSLHCVKAHGALFDEVTRGYGSISTVVLHSYSGSVDQARAWVAQMRHQRRPLAFSFSAVINGSDARVATLRQLAALLEDHHILAESDLPVDRYFLQDPAPYYRQLQLIVETVGAAKNRTVAVQTAAMHAAALQLLGQP